MRRHEPQSRDERGQAFTLEGFTAAFILLIAVLFAVQSVVITPSSGGAVDRTAQAQVQQQVQDALIVAQQDGELSELVRFVDVDDTTDEFQSFHNESDGGQGAYTASDFGNSSQLGQNASTLGAILNGNLEAGQNYNVELYYQTNDEGDRESISLVDEGAPSSTAVTASYTVVLHENQSVTAPGSDQQLGNISISEEGEYIPNLNPGDDDAGLYNVVEIRVTVW
ncbi:hypothetical protein OB919_12115 [Halobacteria archaeon AArc-curdl1]|uniref:Uncharacterized protein n=1 Tax=Natronosalvus hydrolyticus TaxID=2979988 RepID=A0AAP3E6P9_9EURY|nr:hypothetical protein [Halobacteria archaeon AArc-curdl1]